MRNRRWRVLPAGAITVAALGALLTHCIPGIVFPDPGTGPGSPPGDSGGNPRPEGVGTLAFEENLPEAPAESLGFPATEMWAPGPVQPAEPQDVPALGQSKLAIARGLPPLPALPKAALEGVALVDGKPVAAVSRDGRIFLPKATGGWSARQTPMALSNVFASRDSKTGTLSLFAVGTFGRLLISRDGGGSWTFQEVPTPSHMNAFAACPGLDGEPSAWVAVGENGEIVRSRNGADWTRQRATQVKLAFNAVAFPTPESGLAMGEGDAAASVGCCGEVWEPARMPEVGGLALYSVTFTGRTGWAVGERGLVLRSDDGGLSWVLQSVDRVFLIRFAVAVNADTAFFFGATPGEIAVTTDGGRTIVPYPMMPSMGEVQDLCNELQSLALSIPGGRIPADQLERIQGLRSELLGQSEIDLNDLDRRGLDEAKLNEYAAWVLPYLTLNSVKELLAGGTPPEGSPAQVLIPASVASNKEAMVEMTRTVEALLLRRDGDAVAANQRDIVAALWARPPLPPKAQPE